MMNFEKIITTFLLAFFTFLLPHQISILALFSLILLNGFAKYVAVLNDADVRFWQIGKILKRSKCINYVMYSFVGYPIAILAMALFEMVFFGGVGVKMGETTINLTYFVIMLSVTHVFGAIFKSVEDILQHPLFNKIVEKMPKFLQDFFKKESKKD